MLAKCARLLAMIVFTPWVSITQAGDKLQVLVANNANIDYEQCMKTIPGLHDITTCRSAPCYQAWAKSYLERRDAGFQCIHRFGRADIVYYYLDDMPNKQIAKVTLESLADGH